MNAKRNVAAMGTNMVKLKNKTKDIIKNADSINKNTEYEDEIDKVKWEQFKVNHYVTQCRICATDDNKNFGICHSHCGYGPG